MSRGADATADVLVLGGGVIGAATACLLARDYGARVRVLEPDPSYTRASSALSASSIRQQFSTPINIALSQASLAFLRILGDELAVDGERPDVGLVERGYLYLASALSADALRTSAELQRAHGADIVLLDPAALSARYPWLALDGIAAGSLGLRGEGWFDGPALLQAFVRKARALGVRFIASAAVKIETANDRAVAVIDAQGSRHEAGAVLIAAGAWSAPLAAQLAFDLPVRARKRDVFVFRSPATLPGCPLVIDPSGLWFRPDGSVFLCGAPPRGDDIDDAPLDAIDHGLFDDWLWPRLAARVPAFESLRVLRAWAGYYEMNLTDHNGVVGRLPGWRNAFIGCGFSGHGMQHAPAVGRGLAELIATGRYATLDLSPLAPQRLRDGALLIERNVI